MPKAEAWGEVVKYAAYCGTRNIYPDIERSARSIIANSDVDKVYFFIEDDKFPVELPPIIECVNVSNQTYFKSGGPNMKSQYTYMAMMRAALYKLLPDADKVLSLDYDTIAVKDCSHVWDIDISDCYFAATPEQWTKYRPGFIYTNAGVTLFNLEKLRDGKGDEIIDVLNTHYFRWVEQDVCNFLCQGRIAEMDSVYNHNDFVVKSDGIPRIIHYAARNDWRENMEVLKYRDMPWSKVMELHDDIQSRSA